MWARSRLRRQLRTLADDLERSLGLAVDQEAWAIRRDERSWVPVLTGELRTAIDYQTDGRLHARVGVFNPEFHWAVWIEWGRKSADAQPFATPAAEAARRRWPRRAEQTIRRVIT